jgi:Tol biopolymer transport system component
MAKTQNVGALTAAAGALAAVGLLVVIMLVVGTRPAEATFPGPNGKIAYTADDGEFPGGIDSEIYTIAPTGGMAFQVTDNDTEDGSPDYSPDGTKIAFSGSSITNPTGTGDEIYTISVGGGGWTRVTNNDTGDSHPSWGRRP